MNQGPATNLSSATARRKILYNGKSARAPTDEKENPYRDFR